MPGITHVTYYHKSLGTQLYRPQEMTFLLACSNGIGNFITTFQLIPTLSKELMTQQGLQYHSHSCSPSLFSNLLISPLGLGDIRSNSML